MAQRTVPLDNVVVWIDDQAGTVHLSSTDGRLDGPMKLSPRRGTATDKTLRSFVTRVHGESLASVPSWKPASLAECWEAMETEPWYAPHHVLWVCSDPEIRARGEQFLLRFVQGRVVSAVGDAAFDKLSEAYNDMLERYRRAQRAREEMREVEVPEPTAVLLRGQDIGPGIDQMAGEDMCFRLIGSGRAAGYLVVASVEGAQYIPPITRANMRIFTVAGEGMEARARISTAELPDLPPHALLFRDSSGLPCYDTSALAKEDDVHA